MRAQLRRRLLQLRRHTDERLRDRMHAGARVGWLQRHGLRRRDCNGGFFDCNGSVSDGCECSTGTGCCAGGNCQTAAQPTGSAAASTTAPAAATAFNVTEAMAACVAHTGDASTSWRAVRLHAGRPVSKTPPSTGSRSVHNKGERVDLSTARDYIDSRPHRHRAGLDRTTPASARYTGETPTCGTD